MTRNRTTTNVIICTFLFADIIGVIVLMRLIFTEMREADEFMKTARVVRADVVENWPFVERLVRYDNGNEIVTISLQKVISPKSIRRVGKQIDIAYSPNDPNVLRTLDGIIFIQYWGGPIMLGLGVLLSLLTGMLCWKWCNAVQSTGTQVDDEATLPV